VTSTPASIGVARWRRSATLPFADGEQYITAIPMTGNGGASPGF
jgi:hypothetical protein